MSTMESDNFVAQFYELDGLTVDKRRRNLFRLLNNYGSVAVTDLDRIVSILKPRNYLERVFWLESLIYFKRFDELLKEFQSGDDITVCKIMKQPWFFDKLFDHLEPESFVNNVLPTMSFAVRLKVLKKFRLNEETSDKVFEALHQRYGVFLANNILHRCSVTKIRKILEEEPVKLTFAQLKVVVNKEPSLILLYFEQNTKKGYDFNLLYYNPILVYVAQKNPPVYCELTKKYKTMTRLGGRTTKKFVKAAKKEVLSKPDAYIINLRYSSLVRALGVDFKILLLKIFPQNLKELPSSRVYYLLTHFARSGKFNLYKSTYDAVFSKKFGEDIELITPKMLELIADVDDRQNFAKQLIDKRGDENYLKFFSASKCFEILKAKFDLSTILQRTKYVQIMTECCILNQDLEVMLKLAQLLNTRLKNDDASILLDVLKKVFKAKSFAKKLTEEHWSLFYEMLAMNGAKKDLTYIHFKYIFKYIEFLFNKDKSITNVVRQFGYDVLEKDYLLPLLYKNPKLFKAVLLELIEADPNRSEENLRHVHVLIIYACSRYNLQNPSNKICVRDIPKFLETCEYILLNKTSSYLSSFFHVGLSHMITTVNECSETKRLQELFFESFRDLGLDSTLLWFLKNSPELVQRYFDCVFKDLSTNPNLNDKIWKFLKLCTNLELNDRIIQLCLTNLKNENYNKREALVKPLSILMPSSDYAELAKTYEATSKEMEMKDETSREKYKIQLKFAYYLKNINPPAAGLPTVLEFCTNEKYFITTSLSSLYSLVYRTPENQLTKFIKQLDNFKGISVKKHGLILTCVIFDQASVLTCLKTTSIPTLLHALKFFVKNPSDELWEIVKADLLKIEKNNTEMLKLLTEIVVPLRFRTRYNELLWDMLTPHQQPHLLQILLPKILFDNVSFCSKVIKETLMELEEADEFAANFLINTSEVDVIVNALEKFKKHSWNFETKTLRTKEKLRSFITKLFETYMKTENKKNFVVEFLVKFQKIFSISEAFHETVVLKLMSFNSESTEEFARSVVNFSRELTKTFGQMVLHIFADVTSSCLKYFFKRNSERFQFCYALFKLRESVDEDLLVIKLLPASPAEDVISVECYEHMLKVWRDSQDKMVQLQLSL